MIAPEATNFVFAVEVVAVLAAAFSGFAESQRKSMTPSHLAAALLMVTIWGFNFVVIRWGLNSVSPYTLNLLRFILASFPALLFVRPPRAPWRLIVGYGFFAFAVQFSLLFGGMPARRPAIALSVTTGGRFPYPSAASRYCCAASASRPTASARRASAR